MDHELSFEELRRLRQVGRAVDDLLEAALLHRENLEQTFARLFPPLEALLGASAAVVKTRDEALQPAVFHHGDFGGRFPGALLEGHGFGVRLLEDGRTLVSQALDVVGTPVGTLAVLFPGDRLAEAGALSRLVEVVAEQLDTVLAAVQTASEKHQLLVTLNSRLSSRVFEAGMDGAVRALAEKVKLPFFLLLHRDAMDSARLHYRGYRFGVLEYASGGGRTHPELEAAIRAQGPRLIHHADQGLREVLGAARAAETVLIEGVGDAATLGKIVLTSPDGAGFPAYTLDLLRLLASTLSQRLVDYNRERIDLAQFFSSDVIDELLRDPDYVQRYLSARAEEVGILFADINGFTRICERVLERPERIGAFVDDWSDEAVRILHRHGGVFDKMVGDCVIGLFGPPFFRTSRQERALQAVEAARDIQHFTRHTMSAHPELSRLNEVLAVPGPGVAIGVNLTSSYCGLFGPNRNYTSFSTGMNQTARLQSLGGFRETLVMESAVAALRAWDDPRSTPLRFGPPEETAVKNVLEPLRYHRLLE